MVLYGAIQGERSTRTLEVATLALLALVLVLVLRGDGKAVTFNGAFVVDGFARFMKVLTLIGAGAAVLLSADFLRRDGAMRFVLLRGPGDCFTTGDVPPAAVLSLLRDEGCGE